MLSRNIDLNVLRHLIDVVEVERNRNDIQDHRLCEQGNQINEIYKNNEEIIHIFDNQQVQLQECQATLDFLLRKVGQFEYLIGQNQQLEEIADFYLRD